MAGMYLGLKKTMSLFFCDSNMGLLRATDISEFSVTLEKALYFTSIIMLTDFL